MGLQSTLITSYDKGLVKDKKPFLILDQSFQELNNAYVWRNTVKKREGITLVGRMRRVLTSQALGNTSAGDTTTIPDILTTLGLRATEPDAQIDPGTLVITILGADAATFTDDGDGSFTVTGKGNDVGSYVNYATGRVVLKFDPVAVGAVAISADFNYFPALPCMGIHTRELSAINVEQTVFFDTKYAYSHDGNDFSELASVAATTWSGTDSDFFWAANYQGSTPSSRLFFVTNFSKDTSDPIRYYDGSTWATLQPVIADAGGGTEDSLFQAKIIIPYYGRLVCLNTWEGRTAGGFGATTNFFSRCRFSQIGNPIAADAWYHDQFGLGGFIDAPTNENIVSARFYKNTLIVFFERSTWELQYVGEYGLPFVWERISSDFGSESMLSTVLFDEGVLAVGNRAIVSSSGNSVQRIDLEIPDVVYNFNNIQDGKERVIGLRDFRKELVFWTYSDGQINNKFPNRVLVFNYRNNTWSVFRDNVTAFGQFGAPSSISWDTPTIGLWDQNVSWDFTIAEETPLLVCGNQQGYIHFYQYPDAESVSDSNVDARENESLAITGEDRTGTRLRLTVPDHNLEAGEVIYITKMQFIDTSDSSAVSTNLNARFYAVNTIVDADTIDVDRWNVATKSYVGNQTGNTPASGTGTYIGGGEITLLPKLSIVTKDFNPYSQEAKNIMVNYIDFQTDATPNSEVSINLLVDANTSYVGNLLVGSEKVSTSLRSFGSMTNATQTNPCQITSANHGLKTGDQITIPDGGGMGELENTQPFTVTFVDLNNFSLDGIDATAYAAYTAGGYWVNYVSEEPYFTGSQYAWHRFYASANGQYVSIEITYNDEQMASLLTHQQQFEMNAMQIWHRTAGRIV